MTSPLTSTATCRAAVPAGSISRPAGRPIHATTARTAVSVAPVSSTPAATTGSGIRAPAVLSGAFLAALITAIINTWLARRRSREEERSRLRATFAAAFAAYSAYKEFPYAIRRRRADAPGEERVRLSEALRKIQADLAYHLAWTAVESQTIGEAYAELVRQVRQTAGTAMHEAWEAPPTDSDNGMNISHKLVDLSSLSPYEAAYIEAVRTHLRSVRPRRSR